MNIAEMSREEIRQRGLNALLQELGPVGMVRFLQQFETGRGDYTSERHQWLPDDIQAIAEEVQRHQSRHETGEDMRRVNDEGRCRT